MLKQINDCKRVFIFDPCFGEMSGHWENYCKRLYFELVERGYTVKVFGQASFNKKIVEGIVFQPLFHPSPFVSLQHECEFNQQCRLFMDDLNEIDTMEFVDGDLLIFHSIFPQIFASIIDWTKKLVLSKKVITTLFFQFPPTDEIKRISLFKKLYCTIKNIFSIKSVTLPEISWEENENIWHYQKYSTVLRDLIKQGSHLLVASTDVLSKNFSRILDLPVHYLPMPGEKLPDKHRVQHANERADDLNRPKIKVGYFGHSSLEKGGQFLQFLVKKTSLICPSVEFLLHINPNQAVEVHLKCFEANSYPNVKCHYGHLSKEEMMELMGQVDIILMPYSPLKYATTPSAVLMEAMPLGKIFILPKATWAHIEAEKYAAGFVAFAKYNQHSVLKALIEAIVNFKELHMRSVVAAKKFYDENNMSNYLDIFAEVVNRRPREAICL